MADQKNTININGTEYTEEQLQAFINAAQQQNNTTSQPESQPEEKKAFFSSKTKNCIKKGAMITGAVGASAGVFFLVKHFLNGKSETTPVETTVDVTGNEYVQY